MKTMLITGAAGLIGRAACERYKDRYHVIGIDDMSRETAKVPEGVAFIRQEAATATREIQGVDVVLHLAAQVSVMNSVQYPENDFERNAALTFKLAKWAAELNPRPVFIYANTNKVFGELAGVASPILDSQPLDPCTPYGISKATGGMYVREFLPDTGYDFRQSCIFSERQTGTPDQGWVGYIASQIRQYGGVTCFGDGKQVRDLLHVDDLLDAYDLAIEGKLEPGSYNVGGGPSNAWTFEEVVSMLGGFILKYHYARPKDQHCCIMASHGLRRAGWEPKTNSRDVVVKMGVGEKVTVAK